MASLGGVMEAHTRERIDDTDSNPESDMDTTPYEYICGDCHEATTFRLTGIPYRSWVLTCRKCGRYRRHELVLRDPLPRLMHL